MAGHQSYKRVWFICVTSKKLSECICIELALHFDSWHIFKWTYVLKAVFFPSVMYPLIVTGRQEHLLKRFLFAASICTIMAAKRLCPPNKITVLLVSLFFLKRKLAAHMLHKDRRTHRNTSAGRWFPGRRLIVGVCRLGCGTEQTSALCDSWRTTE